MVLIVGQVIAWLEQAQHMPDVYLLALQTFADKMYMVQRFRAWHRSILASSENGWWSPSARLKLTVARDVTLDIAPPNLLTSSLVSALQIFEYNGAAIVAMAGKECVAIGSDLRFGVQFQTLATDYKKVYKIHDKLFIGLAGLGTDAQTM